METEQAPTTKSKRMSNLERLRAQGHLIEVEIGDGQKVPYFKMPTAELQTEFNKDLDKKIRKDLKAAGYELIYANRRDHPLHSEILRDRIDCMTLHRDYRNKEAIKKTRRALNEYAREARTRYPADDYHQLTKHDIDADIESGIKRLYAEWPRAYDIYRDMKRDEQYWRNTRSYKNIMSPTDGPPIPDETFPKPVYVNKDKPDIFLAVRNGLVDLWTRRSLST
jgi:hypothetical protein